MKRLQIIALLTVFLGLPALSIAVDLDKMLIPRCSDPGDEPGSSYYTIELVSTNKIPGISRAAGTAAMTFGRSPFGISISESGSFIHKLDIQISNMEPPKEGVYVAWITTPNLDKIEVLGVLDKNLQTTGTVKWNKYLVVITKEPFSENLDKSWKGPIVLRGMSKSGYMHTMAGHGPFEQDPCAKFGY